MSDSDSSETQFPLTSLFSHDNKPTELDWLDAGLGHSISDSIADSALKPETNGTLYTGSIGKHYN